MTEAPTRTALLNVEGYAEAKGCDPVDVMTAVRRGTLRHIRIGSTVRINAATPWPPDEEGTPDIDDEVAFAVHDFVAKWGRDAVLRQLGAQPIRKTILRKVRAEVLERDGRQCRYCGSIIGPRSVIHLDHVTPKSLGGGDEPENLAVCCRRCNMDKKARPGFSCIGCGRLTWRRDRNLACGCPY